MIIAIDGPAGAGKSTVARAVAEAFGLELLDTGAMYRAVAWRALRAGTDPADSAACARVASSIRLDFDEAGRILVDGEPGEPAIRGEDVTRAVSAVSAHPEVRASIVPLQRARALRGRGLVAEGRDIGTVVFPDADHKFFLIASPEVRARRRALELGVPGREAGILGELRRRDHLDSTRPDSPLARASDAVLVDTDRLDASEAAQTIIACIRSRSPAPPASRGPRS
jgi:cytidylate kinase